MVIKQVIIIHSIAHLQMHIFQALILAMYNGHHRTLCSKRNALPGSERWQLLTSFSTTPTAPSVAPVAASTAWRTSWQQCLRWRAGHLASRCAQGSFAARGHLLGCCAGREQLGSFHLPCRVTVESCVERLLLMFGNMGGSTAEAHALKLLPCAWSAGGWTRAESHGAFLRPRQPLLLKQLAPLPRRR